MSIRNKYEKLLRFSLQQLYIIDILMSFYTPAEVNELVNTIIAEQDERAIEFEKELGT